MGEGKNQTTVIRECCYHKVKRFKTVIIQNPVFYSVIVIILQLHCFGYTLFLSIAAVKNVRTA